MVQKYQSPVRIFKFPFELVMAAYQKRFPTCKMIPVFLGSDIISEYHSGDGAVEVIERRCRLAVDAPYLLKKIIGVEYVNFIQKNSFDARNRTLDIQAHNDSFSSRVIIKEHCSYSEDGAAKWIWNDEFHEDDSSFHVHPENPSWTCFEQQASLDIKSFFGFESTVEKVAMKQYSHNIKKGKEVIEYYINELIGEGVTYIPPWRPAEEKEDPKVVLFESIDESVEKDSACDLDLGATAASIDNEKTEASNLDTEYIERFLGKLNPVQESNLVRLRKWLRETHKGKIPRDNHILRFLKARDFNVEKAREMLCHSLAWRKLHSIDRLLDTYKPMQVLEDYYSGGWHYYDRDDRPLYILRLGQMDVKGLIKAVGEEGILKHVLYVNEEGIRRAEKATKLRGHAVSACTCIVDLEGLSMRHLWRPGIKALLRIIETVEANYPETMGRLLIVRAPRVFPVLWTLISPFIDENTRKKFLIYGGNDFQGPNGLSDYVNSEFIPEFLGGACYCDVPEGGLVPKCLYMFDDDRELLPSEPPLFADSIYQTAHVVKDFPNEVLLNVEKRGCVITWDFDILKGDVTFTLLRCRKPITTDPHQHHVHGAVGGIGSTQYVDKHMVVGIDLSIVQPPHVCRDGDSVQGSHVTSQPGHYILQWKYFNSARSSQSFDFSLSTPKSKVMYYTEILSSEDFRGSMSSLQSCHSSFSSLSIGTSQNSSHITYSTR